MFAGYLRLADRCTACGSDFRIADAGDGPAVFVMFIVGAVVVPLAVILEFAFKVAPLLVVAITAVLAIGLSMLLLRPMKALMFALQWKHKAAESRFGGE
jgi:uncharacterized protein (DUF983 family)